MTSKILNLICVFFILFSFSAPAFAEVETERSTDIKISPEIDILTQKYFTSENINYDNFTESEKKMFQEAYDKWTLDHTFNITQITTWTVQPTTDSNMKELYVTRTYQSDDPKFEEMYGTDTFSSSDVFSIDLQSINQDEKKVLLDGQLISFTDSVNSKTNSSVITTAAVIAYTDPWWIVGPHPKYMWALSYQDLNNSDVYVRKDPINLIFTNTTASAAKSQILQGSAYYNEYWTGAVTLEFGYKVYNTNNTWLSSNSVASGPFRPIGGTHVRLFQLASGGVVGGAHLDTVAPHHVADFENSEKKVAKFFAYNSSWSVNNNSIYLGNSIGNNDPDYPYNSGYATKITRQ